MARTVIISDTHFGADRSAGTPDALRPLWATADELVVNGDVAELQDGDRRACAARMVMRLQELCHADGVRLTLISGNHDPLLTDERFLELADGAVFVTHGDVLHPAISPWAGSADELRAFNEGALAKLDECARADVLGKLAAAQHAALRKEADPTVPWRRRPRNQVLDQARRTAAVLYYWHVLPQRAAEFAAEHAPAARFFVFGHMHRAGVWIFGDLAVINTGCFGVPALPPRAVIVDDDTLAVRSIHLTSNGQYSFGRGVERSWLLGEAPRAAA